MPSSPVSALLYLNAFLLIFLMSSLSRLRASWPKLMYTSSSIFCLRNSRTFGFRLSSCPNEKLCISKSCRVFSFSFFLFSFCFLLVESICHLSPGCSDVPKIRHSSLGNSDVPKLCHPVPDVVTYQNYVTRVPDVVTHPNYVTQVPDVVTYRFYEWLELSSLW